MLRNVLFLAAFGALTACGTSNLRDTDGGSGADGGPNAEGGLGAWAYVQSIAAVGPRLVCGLGVNGGVFTSNDNGASWSPLNDGLSPMPVVHQFATRGTDLFAAADDVYLLPDNGTSWHPIHTVPGGGGIEITAVAAKDQLILAGAYLFGARRSPDNGATWSATSLTKGQVNAFAFAGTSTFAGLGAIGRDTDPAVQKSDDNGVTWVPAATGLPSDANVLSLAVNGTQLLVGIASMGPSAVYASTDNGASWVPKGAASDGFNTVTSLVVVGAKTYAGTRTGVWVTADSGTSWTQVDIADLPEFPIVWGMAVSGPSLFIGTYTSGVWRHAL
jgi:photosystem II stability/assembly factor-like uncharacterized protein